MTRRQSQARFIAYAVAILIAGSWATTAVANNGPRSLRDARTRKGINLVVIENAFALGTWSGGVRRIKGLSIDESGINQGRAIELTLAGLQRTVVVDGVRPFFETGIELTALETTGFARSGGGSGAIERSTRWRFGGGLAIPIDVASQTMTLEPSLHYALTAAKFSNQKSGLDYKNKHFTSHAIQLRLGSVIPIGTVGSIKMSADLGARAHIPISSTDSTGATLAASSKVDLQGGIGIRGEFTGIFGY
jgi:hypothetical protein